MNIKKCLAAALSLAGVAQVGVARDAPIIWGTPQGITSVSDVSLTGSLIGALRFLGDGATVSPIVNGVEFLALQRGSAYSGPPMTSGTFSIGAVEPDAVWGPAYTTGGIPASINPAPDYLELLSEGMRASRMIGGVQSSATLALTMSDLTPGNRYEFQAWCSTSNLPGRLVDVTGGGSTVRLSTNTGTPNAGIGQFVIGTFVANGPSQTVTFFSPDAIWPVVNGFQLRLVPTPGPAAALGFGGLIAARRRR